jgi:hypothetical protein
MEAYLAWSGEGDLERRAIKWELYVDIRDGLERGTTTKRREEEEPRGDARVIFLDLDG